MRFFDSRAIQWYVALVYRQLRSTATSARSPPLPYIWTLLGSYCSFATNYSVTMPGVKRAFREHTLIFASTIQGEREAEEIFTDFLDSYKYVSLPPLQTDSPPTTSTSFLCSIVPRPVVLSTWRHRDNKQCVMILFPSPRKARTIYEQRVSIYRQWRWLARNRRSFSPQENWKRNRAIDALIAMHESQGTSLPIIG